MRKISIVFVLLLCVLSVYAAPNNNAAETIEVKQYSFAEELVNLPIKEFVVGAINENDLLSADPQALKLYESAINAEKSPDVFKNPASAVNLWQDLMKVAQNNPFMKIAQKRLGEWKTLLALYEKHQGNLDKFKILFASSALPATQKVSLAQKHFGEFGVTFGTQEIINMLQSAPEKEEILSNDAFKAQVKEIKEKRCKLGVTSECSEKAEAPKPEAVAAPVQEAPKADDKSAKTYTLSEEPLNLVNPPAEVNGSDVMNSDAEVLKLFEAASAVDRQTESLSTPSKAVSAWANVEKAQGNNPFTGVAQQRIKDWNGAIAKLDAHEADLSKLKTDISNTSVTAAQKAQMIVDYLDKHGVIFGTADVLNLIAPTQNGSTDSNDMYQNYAYYVSESSYKELSNNDSVKAKIKDTRNKRCELQSGIDCKNYAENHAANDAEKAAYLKKACDYGVQDSCAVQVAEAAPQQTVAPKQETKAPTENDKYKQELNDAGRRARIIAASATLAAGVVIAGLGGASFYGMNWAKKQRNNAYDEYLAVTPDNPDPDKAELYQDEEKRQEIMDYYRNQTNDYDKKRKTYLILGAVGAGVGVALIATGITLFCIEFDGEKEVKKKYNVSFGANPLNGSFQFAMNW